MSLYDRLTLSQALANDGWWAASAQTYKFYKFYKLYKSYKFQDMQTVHCPVTVASHCIPLHNVQKSIYSQRHTLAQTTRHKQTPPTQSLKRSSIPASLVSPARPATRAAAICWRRRARYPYSARSHRCPSSGLQWPFQDPLESEGRRPCHPPPHHRRPS